MPPLLSTESAPVVCLFVCLFVPSCKPQFAVDWRLLVKERIANIEEKKPKIFPEGFDEFCV